MPSKAAEYGRTPLLVGNWKMNLTYSSAVTLSQLVVDRLERSWKGRVDVVMCPPFTALRGVSNVIAFSRSYAQVGAQHCFWEEEGAFTGEVSPQMIADLDCSWCIVGHSERRSFFGQTDEQVGRICNALVAHRVAPIVCVGEPAEVYDADETVPYVTAQLSASLEGVDAGRGDFAVAYEPVWAIGSGRTPSPEHAQAVAAALRSTLADMWGPERADAVRVLYGGSVKPSNVAAFVACPDIDGALVGGASLDASSFIELVKGVLDA